MAKICKNCGVQWEDDVQVCGRCGTPFVSDEMLAMEAEERKRTRLADWGKLLLLLALVLGILIAAWSLIAFLHSEKTETAARDTATVQVASASTVPEVPAAAEETAAVQHCVVIDPGHQRNGSAALEPVGPNSTEMKARVTGGTTGRFTGVPEYELNLQLGLQLKEELEQRGYQVVMTRETHDVDLSNQERAQIAADANGDVFVRIHANGSEDPASEGAMTICMTPNSPYHPELYAESYALSDAILSALVESTGCRREYVWETDTMSGINWSTIPVTIVEVGYLTNEKEDKLLSTAEYQTKVVTGIADGIDGYFHGVE